MISYSDFLKYTNPTNFNSFMDLKINSIINSSRSIPPPDSVTHLELEVWWNKKKQELLKEFEKIVEQKINDYVNFNRERQKIHFTNNQ